MAPISLRLLACIGVLLVALGQAKPLRLRGLDPALKPNYDNETGKFTCLDGSRTIPFNRVNDDFCDCADGSDEPGTSACYNGRFYCRNLGHVPKTILSTFVDDGVCDCCDGSDEKSGCSNKCLEEAAAIKEALQSKLANYDGALAKRAEYIERAKVKRAEMVERRANIDQEIEDQKRLIMELKDEKARLDEEEAARKAEQEAAAEADASAQAAAEGDATAEHQHHEERVLAEEQDVQEVPKEETAEERGRRIASQWTNDPDAALKDAEAEAQAEPHHDEYLQEPDHTDTGSQPGSQDVQSRIWTEESTLTQLEDTRTKLDKQLVMDFGPEDLYLPLLDECYESDAVKYVYQVCMFDKAVQREGYTETDIGKWGRFLTEDGATKMVYENGAYCWEGPNRSMSVTLECGQEEKLRGGGEPSKCVYAATLETPAMCSQEERIALTQRLQDLETLEAQIAQQLKDEL